MNRKGFTLLELLTSLTLTSIVCILLFQVVFILKDIYVDDAAKTEILIKKANIIEEINSTFEKNPIVTARQCNNGDINCFNFTLENGLEYEILLNHQTNVIKVGDLSIKFSDSAQFYDDLDVCYYPEIGGTNYAYNEFLKIRIPLEDNILEERFDINVIYQYNGSSFPNLSKEDINGVVTRYIPQC